MAIAQPANLKGKHGEWQVYSQMEALDGMVRIYIIHGRETKRFIASFEKDGSITINEIQEGATPIKPTMMIPMTLWYAMSDLFGEVISPKIKEAEAHIIGNIMQKRRIQWRAISYDRANHKLYFWQNYSL